MERVLRILLIVSILSGSGDAIVKNDPIARRYGGSNKRPSQYSSSYGNSHGVSSGYQSATYGTTYNMPGPTYNTPSFSYNRPFGYPEGQKFLYGGFTYKTPQVPPPLPPLKAVYKSKPYPDFVVRFKSPLYPAEVATLDKPKPFSYGIPSTFPAYSPPVASSYGPGPVPVYQQAAPVKAPIPIYGGQHGGDKQVLSVIATSQDVNVGTSYQAGNNINYGSLSPPVYGNVPISSQVKPGLTDLNSLYNQGPVTNLPSSVELSPVGARPHATAVYVIDTHKVDKFKITSLDGQTIKTSHQPFEVAGFDKDSVFGTNAGHVIKPVTPDVVYTPNNPNNDQDFKPMYLFGPVYFPKGQKTLRDNAESGSSTSELKSAVPVECDKTVNPNCTTSVETVAAKPVIATQETTEAPVDSSNNNDKEDDNLDELEDSPSLLRGSGGGRRRGLIGVVKTLFGLDDNGRDDDLSRVDEELGDAEDDGNNEESLGVDTETSVAGDSADDQLTSNRDSIGKRKRPSRVRSKSRYYSRSKLRGGGNRRKTTFANDDRSEETLRTAGHEMQNGHTISRPEPVSNEQDPSPVSPEEHEQNFNDGAQLQQPLIGPLHIGYIGRPPDSSEFDPRHPFFYPAGIPPHPEMASNNAFPINGENGGNNGIDTERGDFQRPEDTPNSGSRPEIFMDSQPQHVPPAHLSIAPTVELEQPQPLNAPASTEHHPGAPVDSQSSLENPNNSDNEILHHQNDGEINSQPPSPIHSQSPLETNHYHFDAGVPNQQQQQQPQQHQQEQQQPLQEIPQEFQITGNEFHQATAADHGLGSSIEKYDDATPRHEITQSTEYQNHDFTTEDPYPTYPQTNSYGGQVDSTSSSYHEGHVDASGGRYQNNDDNNNNNNNYPNGIGSHVLSTGIDQQFGGSDPANGVHYMNSNSNNNYYYKTSEDVNAAVSAVGDSDNFVIKNDIVTAEDHNPPALYDYTSSNPFSDAESTSKSYVDVGESISVSSTEQPNSYSTGSRRISSNYRRRFRSGQRPKNPNYVEPTTYRPAYFTRINGVEETTVDALAKEDSGDNSATMYNSLNYDVSSFTTPSPLEMFSSSPSPSHVDTFEQFRPVISDLRYGERIAPKRAIQK